MHACETVLDRPALSKTVQCVALHGPSGGSVRQFKLSLTVPCTATALAVYSAMESRGREIDVPPDRFEVVAGDTVLTAELRSGIAVCLFDAVEEAGALLHLRCIIRSDKLQQPGKLFVIIGRHTFSAAQNTTSELERRTMPCTW